ncbi:MAG TPA: NADPH:quinone reductase [Vicinamibacteria bacterium]|jgi:NADPH2:quinone reductase|nr:NADPH:quinone reductase [Vicinamibacteria bacterium]
MKAVVVHEFGGPEVLKLEDVPTPRPAGGQVLVRIRAAGVNPYDTLMRSGTYAVKPPLPYTPGSDGAGDIEAVGDNVSRVKPGDRVYTAKTLTGAYAEYALTLESQVHSLPSNINYAQGAGIWVPYGTAFHALRQVARARAGETLLVHGASGGVGVAAVQIGRALGMTVLGTAGTEKGLTLCKREGAQHAFDHTNPTYRDQILKATGGLGVDLILEMLANVNLGHDLKLLAPQGRVVVIGSRGDVSITPRDLMTRRGSIHAFTLWGVTEPEEKEIHAGLIAGLENNTLRPVVGKELPLAEAARAHKEIVQPGAYGKVVLVP